MTRLPMMLASVATALLSTDCGPVGDALFEKGMSVAANDQIMLVRAEPPSFGYQRLATQARVYPDIDFFITKHGLPDFLAETHNRERHYFILYYLKDREAFACRSRSGSRGAVEFAGPYPITDREYRTLSAFRKDPGQRPPAW